MEASSCSAEIYHTSVRQMIPGSTSQELNTLWSIIVKKQSLQWRQLLAHRPRSGGMLEDLLCGFAVWCMHFPGSAGGVTWRLRQIILSFFKQRYKLWETLASGVMPCHEAYVPDDLVTLFPAWCLRNEGVSSVLLGSSNPEQLIENLGAIQASAGGGGTSAEAGG